MSNYLGVIPYTGNKQSLLKDLLPMFPEKVGTFYDVFCGGLSVSLNVPYPVVSMDIEKPLVDMYNMLLNEPDISFANEIIEEYRMTPSNDGPYYSLRTHYNDTKDPKALYVLLMFAYCNLYRTNLKGGFNAPFGNNRNRGVRGGYKDVWLERFNHMHRKKETGLTIINAPYHTATPLPGDFVYCDPPYLITGAQYNSKWKEENEIQLYNWLDELDSKGVKFGLSNAMEHGGRSNDILIEWAKKYDVIDLDKRYMLKQIQGKENEKTREVYVCNTGVNSNPYNLEDFM